MKLKKLCQGFLKEKFWHNLLVRNVKHVKHGDGSRVSFYKKVRRENRPYASLCPFSHVNKITEKYCRLVYDSFG
jgi:hypothetical protein